MRKMVGQQCRSAVRIGCLSVVVLIAVTGCAGSTGAFGLFGTPYAPVGTTDSGITGPGQSGTVPGGALGGSGRSSGNPCDESQNRKFFRLTLRNDSQDYIHYFLVLVAYVYGDTHPTGAVCPDDVETYVANGYDITVEDGQQLAFGNECIEGPALIYFHEAGRFQGVGGSRLSSGIPPAEGSTPAYDAAFTASGRRLPVPNLIWFHNPGGEGDRLRWALKDSAPCATGDISIFTGACEQDSFYYVDERDNPTGSNPGSRSPYVRFPSEIQGTGCRCFGSDQPWAELAPTGATAATARCNEFLRGGWVEFVFLNDDSEPPPPQLIWRVRDASGAVAHEFDERANVN